MDNARKVAEYIHNNPIRGYEEEELKRTATLIGYFVKDIIKVINDISKNSLNEDDAYKRLSELSKKCGININLKLNI